MFNIVALLHARVILHIHVNRWLSWWLSGCDRLTMVGLAQQFVDLLPKVDTSGWVVISSFDLDNDHEIPL